jgi:dienelactone hydrolase
MTVLRIQPRRVLVRTWPLLLALALLAAAPLLLSMNRQGRVAVKASIFLPDMVLQVPLPFRPVDLVSDPPRREHVFIEYESRNGPRTIEGELYTPAHGAKHAGVVFSMGAPPLVLDDPRLVRIAEDASRSGVVMLVPFSDRLDELRIEPEEIDALVAEFQYVRALPDVDPARMGFFGASVGGSLALVAAADPRIADEVQHVVSFGGYFDALPTFGAIVTHHIEYQDVDEPWTPKIHANIVVTHQLIDRVDSEADRALLARWFLDGEPASAQGIATLSPIGLATYNFLANRDPQAVQRLIDRLPQTEIDDMNYLSPRSSIANVKADLIILHDQGDPFIPYTESRRLQDAVGARPNVSFDELRLFDHVSPKLNTRPEIVALDSTRLLFRLYQLLLRWE